MNGAFWLSYGLVWAVVAIQGLAFLEILRQVGQVRDQLGLQDGPMELFGAVKVGEPLPETLAHRAVDDRPVEWNEYEDRDALVLVFLHPGCLTCHTVAKNFPIVPDQATVRVVAVVEGRSFEDAREFMVQSQLPPDSVILDAEATLSRDLNLKSKPTALTVRSGRMTRAATVSTPSHLQAVIQEAGQPIRETGPKLDVA